MSVVGHGYEYCLPSYACGRCEAGRKGTYEQKAEHLSVYRHLTSDRPSSLGGLGGVVQNKMRTTSHEKRLTQEDPGDLEVNFEHGVEPRIRKRQLSQQPLPIPLYSDFDIYSLCSQSRNGEAVHTS